MSTAQSTGVSPAAAARLIARDIKLSHSVFALPFALLAAFMAGPVPGAPAGAWWAFAAKVGVVVLCMVLARTWAMLVNRLVDRRIDAKNERTKGRAFASGALPARLGWLVAGACALSFIGAAGLFEVFWNNRWPLMLSIPVLAWIAFYSFTKRFTFLCHVFLGSALAASPLAATVAVEPSRLASAGVWWLGGFVLAWVAGFDVIYAMQDEAFDREHGLRSAPQRLGRRGAAWFSRGLHAMGFVCLLAAWTSVERFGAVFGVGVGVVGALLALEHAVVAARGRAGLNMAFFTINGVASCVLGVLGIVDWLR